MSVESIATVTGVSKPTIYRRWPTKEALALAACENLRVPDPPEPTGDLERDLAAQLGHLRTALGQSDDMPLLDALLVEERHTPALLEMFRARAVTPCREAMRDVIADARDRGEVRADVDLDAAVDMLVGAYYARYIAGERFPTDWAQAAVRTLLAGISR
jgi:AcrR family transcriptional regulator